MKILMVNLSFLPDSLGGTEVYTYNLSRALIAAGHDVSVFTSLDDPSASRYELKRSVLEGIRVAKVVNAPRQARKFTDYFMDATVERVFEEAIREERPDIIHFQHLAYLSGAMPEVASREGVPSILTLHDYWYLCRRSHLVRPGVGICGGPRGGAPCATCHDTANPGAFFVSPADVRNLGDTIRRWLAWARQRLSAGQRSLGIKRSPDDAKRGQIDTPRWIARSDEEDRSRVEERVDPVMLAENTHRHEFFLRQLRFPAVLLSPSEYLRARYEAEGFPPVSVLPLGFPPCEPAVPMPFGGKLRVAFIGNMLRTKGPHVILRELEDLARSDKVEVHLHGWSLDEAYLAELQAAVDLYPAGTAWLHGPYRGELELERILAEVHLTIFPSLWEENYPLVVREALIRGVPVVGSTYGGVREAIKTGVNGLLFDPRQEGDLSRTISQIVERPEWLEELRTGARQTEIETQDAHVGKLLDIYASVARSERAEHDAGTLP